MPVLGKIFKETLIFIIACRANWLIKPTIAIIKNCESKSNNLLKTLKMIKQKIATINRQTIMPSSSPATAKIKSVCESGRKLFITPSPGPLPKNPPLIKASKDLVFC